MLDASDAEESPNIHWNAASLAFTGDFRPFPDFIDFPHNFVAEAIELVRQRLLSLGVRRDLSFRELSDDHSEYGLNRFISVHMCSTLCRHGGNVMVIVLLREVSHDLLN